MAEDLDDTVIVPPRAAAAAEPDLDDTVIGSRQRPVVVPQTPIESAPTASAPERAAIMPGVYSFRIGERSEVIALDRPAYIGRKPSSPRVVAGVSPRLVRVPSPLHEVSASHLEVRQLGASVVVTDLRSTNGSTVLVPGSVPRKLRQGESVVVSPGTLVDIGDHNILQILPMQRPV